MKTYSLILLSLTACGTASTTHTNALQTAQASVAEVLPSPTPYVAPEPTVSPAQPTTEPVQNANVAAEPNSVNTPTCSQTDPNTQLLNLKCGVFQVGGDSLGTGNYDECGTLSGTMDPTHPGGLHPTFMFWFDASTMIAGPGNSVVYQQQDGASGLWATTMLYPDGTGTIAWHGHKLSLKPNCATYVRVHIEKTGVLTTPTP